MGATLRNFPIQFFGIDGVAGSPTFSFLSDGDTGIFRSSSNIIGFTTGGVERCKVSGTSFLSGTAGGFALMIAATSATIPTLCPNSSDTDTGCGQGGANILSLIAGGIEGIHINAGLPVFIGAIKATTGDPGSPEEGQLTINTFDNAIKIFADAGWRTLASW
jgi:hypothetical protein